MRPIGFLGLGVPPMCGKSSHVWGGTFPNLSNVIVQFHMLFEHHQQAQTSLWNPAVAGDAVASGGSTDSSGQGGSGVWLAGLVAVRVLPGGAAASTLGGQLQLG